MANILTIKRALQKTISEDADSGLAAKAQKSGISIGTLRKVYRRGVAAWNSGHRPGTTPQQWGMARVNSYITKGKGTYHGADKDLRNEEIQWTKPKKDEHDEVYNQLDAQEQGAGYPDHVHKMLKHLADKDNFNRAMKNAKPMTITHKDLQPGGKHADISNTEANESNPKMSGLNQEKVRRVQKVFKDTTHGKPVERPIVLHDTATGHTHLLAGNTRLTYNTHYGSGSTQVHAITYNSKQMNEEVAKDKESGLPKKYVSGLSTSTAKARAAHWKKMGKLSDRDPAAYEPAPGDKTAKTKESKHTKRFRQLFGESFLLEYLTDDQRAEYSKYGMSRKARKDTDHFFGAGVDQKREELKSFDGDKSEVHKAVERHLGKEITHDDYKKGITTDKYQRPARIGKMVKDENLRHQYARDSTRAGSQKNNGHYVTVVRGTEVAGQTNSSPNNEHPRGHSWGEMSCKNVDDGSMKRILSKEIEHGTAVVRVHDHNDKEIYRATLQPHHNDKGHVAYAVDSEYGVNNDSFTKHARDVANRLTGEHKGGSYLYTKHDGVYSDNGEKTLLHPSIKPEVAFKDKNIDQETLHHLADNEKSDSKFAHEILAHPKTDQKVTESLAKHQDPKVVMAAINHPKADKLTLQKAVLKSDNSDVIKTALAHPKADSETVRRTAWKKNEDFVSAAINHPLANNDVLADAANNHNTPKAAISAMNHPSANKRIIYHGIMNRNPDVAVAALKHPKADSEIVDEAAKHKDSKVVMAALNHPLSGKKTPINAILNSNKDPKVALAALNHKEAGVKAVNDAIEHHGDNKKVALAALAHPMSNHTTTEIGVKSDDKDVAMAALNHKNAYHETTYFGARHEDPDVAMAAINHPSAGATTYLTAKNHQDPKVRMAGEMKMRENYPRDHIPDKKYDVQEGKTMSTAKTVKRIAKGSIKAKKKLIPSDLGKDSFNKGWEDWIARQHAEQGYDQDAIRYGMKEETIAEASPKQKQELTVTGYTDGKTFTPLYDLNKERVTGDMHTKREKVRVAVGDTAMRNLELQAKQRTEKSIGRPLKIAESKITSEVKDGVIHINGKPVDHSSIEVDGVDRKDYPDFSDAYVTRAEFNDGEELSDEHLDHLSDKHGDVVHEKAHEAFRDKINESPEQINEWKKKKPSGVPEDKSRSCWSGYTQYGMKMKNGRSVPNCVKDK